MLAYSAILKSKSNWKIFVFQSYYFLRWILSFIKMCQTPSRTANDIYLWNAVRSSDFFV